MRVLIILILSMSGVAKAQYSTGSSFTRGVFCLGFMGLYDQTRLLNQDGTYSLYKGYGYGSLLDIKLFDLFEGEFRVFGGYNSIGLASTHDSTETLKNTESLMGIKLFTNQIFFVSGAVGRSDLKFSDSDGSVEYTHGFSSMGAGLEFSVADNWYWAIHGYYKTGAIPVNSTSALQSNSFRESLNFSVGVIWSPMGFLSNSRN